MPRSVHAHGRPGTTVFPADWADTGAVVADKTADCTVTVGPTGTTSGWDPDSRTTTTAASPAVYTGPARVGPVAAGDGTEVETAGDDVTVAGYAVVLSLTVAGAGQVQIGHRVYVDTSGDDALTGRTLRVTGVALESRAFTRLVYADLTD